MNHIHACFGKSWFDSFDKAQRAGKRDGLEPYRCKLCPGWHLARP
jgi:hypothetical protein